MLAWCKKKKKKKKAQVPTFFANGNKEISTVVKMMQVHYGAGGMQAVILLVGLQGYAGYHSH